MAVNKDKSIQVCITLPKELCDKIDKIAKADDRSRSKMIAKMVKDQYTEKYEKEE